MWIISADGFVIRDKAPYCLQHGKPMASPAKSFSKEMGAIIIETNYISEKKIDTLSPKSPRPTSDASKSPKPATPNDSKSPKQVTPSESKSPKNNIDASKSPKSPADPKSPKSNQTDLAAQSPKTNSPKSAISVDTSKSLPVDTARKSPKSPSNKPK